MKRHSFRRRLGTGLMALCMLAMMPSGALADSVTEAETEKQQLEQEHQQLENELDALQQQEADKQAEQQDLETQITDLQGADRLRQGGRSTSSMRASTSSP